MAAGLFAAGGRRRRSRGSLAAPTQPRTDLATAARRGRFSPQLAATPRRHHWGLYGNRRIRPRDTRHPDLSPRVIVMSILLASLLSAAGAQVCHDNYPWREI